MQLRPAVICWLLCCGLAWGQDRPAPPAPVAPTAAKASPPDKPTPDRTPATLPAAVPDAQLPLYYLKDKQGNLQAVPGFRFEDFVELYKVKNQLEQRERKPSYSLARMMASGSVTGDRAEWNIQFTIVVEPGQWARIPLRLNQGVLSEPARSDGGAPPLLQFEPGGDGHVCWLEGQAERRQQQITLKMLVPVLDLGDGSRMKLFLPRAAVSQLKLSVPVASAEAKVSPGATLLAPVAAEKGSTEFTVQGAAGDFELSWAATGAKPIQRPGEIEALGTVLVRAGAREIGSEVTLSVRSYGEPFDRFRVRLPRGAELVTGGPAGSGYRVVPLELTVAGSPLAEVQLQRKTAGPVEVRLATRRSLDPAKSNEWTELAGFEVVQAARQWGHVAVATVGDWHVLWGPSRGVRQVDQWPEVLRYEDVVAGFEYFAQPYSLTVRLVPRKAHVSVEPEYQVLIDADQMRLEAKWKYLIRGAKIFACDVKLEDWIFDQIEPENLVAVDGVAVTAGQMLSIPLQQPATGQLELVLRAHRPILPDAKTLQFVLPQPQVNTLGPAALTVVPADNVELLPDAQNTKGLSRQPLPAPLSLPDRHQEPLFYRGEANRGAFAAGFEVHTRSLSVDVASQVDVDSRAAQVEQKFSYSIAYESLDRLTLSVPRSLAGAEGWGVFFEGRQLPVVRLGEASQRQPGTDLVAVAVALPRAYIGRCELVLRYSVPLAEITTAGTSLQMPLAMPGEGKLLDNKLSVTAVEGIAVQSSQSAWTPIAEDLPRPEPIRDKQWAATGPVFAAELTLTRTQRNSQPETVIERLWLQSWLTRTTRQDRAVFRFVTQQKQLELRIPDGIVQNPMPIFLDNQPIELRVTGEGNLAVALPADGAGRPHLLELRYHFRDSRPHRGEMLFEFPQLGRDVWVRRFYWQLILPHNEHLVTASGQLTSEHVWQWCEYFWGRQPTLDQSQLEAWAGAPNADAPSSTANQYLFSGVGKLENVEAWTAPRSWIVLAASGAVLFMGLLLIYVRWARHPATLLTATVLLLALGALYPEPAMLLAQAALLGLALSVLAGLLQRSASRRRRGGAYHDGTPAPFEKGSTQIQPSAAPVGNQASTQSAPTPASLEWDV
jgi:hypothetical protein